MGLHTFLTLPMIICPYWTYHNGIFAHKNILTHFQSKLYGNRIKTNKT